QKRQGKPSRTRRDCPRQQFGNLESLFHRVAERGSGTFSVRCHAGRHLLGRTSCQSGGVSKPASRITTEIDRRKKQLLDGTRTSYKSGGQAAGTCCGRRWSRPTNRSDCSRRAGRHRKTSSTRERDRCRFLCRLVRPV